MGANKNIEWCDSTVNPTSGCDGCELYSATAPARSTCYARSLHEERLARSLPALYAPSFSEVRLLPGRMKKAAAWEDLRGMARPHKPWLLKMPRLIFVGDLSDVLSKDVSDDYFVNEILGQGPLSAPGQRHLWMILTKRPERLAQLSEQLPEGLPSNVIAMTTITNQATANRRLPALRAVRCRWRALSIEPLLDSVVLRQADPQWYGGMHLVIVGGESGENGRPCRLEHLRSLVAEAQSAHTPAFVKQLGKLPQGSKEDDAYLRNSRSKKGGELLTWPPDLRVRQFPSFSTRTPA